MNWLKQNWFKIGILGIALVAIILLGWDKTPENTSEIQSKSASSNDQRFDLDLSQLQYSPPLATKICIPVSKVYCSSEDGCVQGKPSVFLLINEVDNKYYRCDDKPCDEYDYSSNISGIYNIIRPLPPKHGEIKLSNDGSYYEAVSLGLDLFISYGICQNIL